MTTEAIVQRDMSEKLQEQEPKQCAPAAFLEILCGILDKPVDTNIDLYRLLWQTHVKVMLVMLKMQYS